MKGSIYSDQKCAVCGGRFLYDERRRGLFCKKHPDQQATGRFRVLFGRGEVHKRFGNDFVGAERFLTGIRYEQDKGTFDARDYRKDNPLGFSNMADRWLALKADKIKPKTLNNLKNYMARAKTAWEQTSVKDIGYAQIEDFLHEQRDISDKTKSNIRSALNSFFDWLVSRQEITRDQKPEIPSVTFELGWRETVSKATQQAILEEIRRITAFDPKIHMGILWLTTYLELRPADVTGLLEKHVVRDEGFLLVPKATKKGGYRIVKLIAEDAEAIRLLPKGFPDLPFFRHGPGRSGVTPGDPYGEKYFYKWWKRACENLGIEGVDLYGGTKHSSARAMGEFATPEQAKMITGHQTSKAFERYFMPHVQDKQALYEQMRGGKQVANKKPVGKIANRLKTKH